MRNLNLRLATLEDERAALLKKYTPVDSHVVSKDQQIAEMRAQVEAIQSGAGKAQRASLTAPDPASAQLESGLEAVAMEIENQSKEIARQTATIEEKQRSLSAHPVNDVNDQQTNAVAREIETVNQDIADLQRKQQQSDLAANMGNRDQQEFRLVDPPNLPTHPASKKRQTYSLAAAAAGPVVGFILAFLLDLRKTAFQSENELKRTFAPPLVISIPVLPTARERRTRAWQTGFELFAGSVVLVAIVATEFYAYKLFS